MLTLLHFIYLNISLRMTQIMAYLKDPVPRQKICNMMTRSITRHNVSMTLLNENIELHGVWSCIHPSTDLMLIYHLLYDITHT